VSVTRPDGLVINHKQQNMQLMYSQRF
jgi:hypothetical protein